ncbi:hypothetical protein [Enterococcus sp. LJL90]
MKKVLGGLLVTGMFILGGCGSSARDDFADTWDEVNDFSQYNAIDFSLTVDELTMDGGTTSSSDEYDFSGIFDSLMSSLQGMGIGGNVLIDQENEAVEYNFNLNFMDNEFPFEMIMAGDETYISGDAYVQILTLMSSLYETGVDFSGITDQISGKYVEANPDDFGDTFSTSDLTDLLEVDDSAQTTYLAEYTRTLDESTFEQDGDKISHTYTLEEIEGYYDFVQENGTDEDIEELGEFDSADITDFELMVTLDTSNNSAEFSCTMTNDDADGTMTMGFTGSLAPTSSDETVTVPSGDQVVTEDQLDTMLTESATYQLSEDEFNELLTSIEGAQDYYTKDEIIEMFEAEGITFSDDQIAQIEALYPAV